MRHLLALIIAASLSSPVSAEDSTMDSLLKQFDDLSKNAQTLLEGWVEDLGPKLEELGPTLESFADKIGDMSAYHPPEVLENGDIIIRKKVPAVPEPQPDLPSTKETIDL